MHPQLQVWTWYAYEPSLGQELAFVAAVYRPGDLGTLRTRLRLVAPASTARIHPATPGFQHAAAAPMRVWWMPLESFARRSPAWLSEEQLSAARRQHATVLNPSA